MIFINNNKHNKHNDSNIQVIKSIKSSFIIIQWTIVCMYIVVTYENIL